MIPVRAFIKIEFRKKSDGSRKASLGRDNIRFIISTVKDIKFFVVGFVRETLNSIEWPGSSDLNWARALKELTR